MTPSEKKAREMEAREILGKGLQSHWRKVKPCGIFGEGVEIVTDYKDVLDELIIALDDAERRGFERAKRMVLNSWPSYILYEERSAIENLKYEEPMSDKPEGTRKKWIKSNGQGVKSGLLIEVEIKHFNPSLKLANKIVRGSFGEDGFFLEDGDELSYNWNIVKWRHL